MKRSRIILLLAFLFATIKNNTFATTNVSSANINNGSISISPFAFGAILIILVLIIGYKMDKSVSNTTSIKKTKEKNKFDENTKINLRDYSSIEESKIYADENKADIPYEADKNEYYESENDFDYSALNEDTEYEEDDISLFTIENYKEEDDFSNKIEKQESFSKESDMKLNSNNVNDNKFSTFQNSEKTFEKDEFDYSDAVEGLEEKIDSLEDLNELPLQQNEKIEIIEKQDAKSFMDEINKYKEEAEHDDFEGFTTKSSLKIEKEEKKNTRKNISIKEEKIDEDLTNQIDIDFLSQMEQNLKNNQKERIKKLSINSEVSEKTPKKRGRKPKNQ